MSTETLSQGTIDMEDGTDENDVTENENQDTAEDQEQEHDQDNNDSDDDDGSEDDKTSHINQEAVNKAINKKHFKMMEAIEKANALEAKVAELEAKLTKNSDSGRPTVPNLPEPFDPDYDTKMAARDKAIQEQFKYDLMQKVNKNKSAQSTKQQQNSAQEEARKLAAKFSTNAKKAGVKAEDLRHAETVVASYIKDPAVRVHLLSSEDGPLWVSYLANNPFELEKLSSMDSVSAGVYLNSNVSPQAIKLKKRTTKSPNPLTQVPKGRITDKARYPLSAGGTIE